MMNALDSTSTRPYLLRALYEWCTDNALTPYIAVLVDDTVQVPREYVQNGEIVLNISFDATSGLKLGNDFVEFKARFGGTAREIMVPIDRVIAIYARENGQGMAFPVPTSLGGEGVDAPTSATEDEPAAAAAESGVADKASAEERSVGLHLARAPKPAKEKTVLKSVESESRPASAGGSSDDSPEPPPSGGGRPTLRRIK